MSRSKPNENTPNPSTRWFDWKGDKGVVQYYDKQEKKNVEVGSEFTFILLDQLSTVKGWHDSSESGIFSNEVKDTKKETLAVKAFKGGTLAEGFYAQIRDRVIAAGGKFVSNCYIAFRDENKELKIGSIQFSGSSLSAWMDFAKLNRMELYKQAIQIKGYGEGKKGSITYRFPKFHIKPITEETNIQATALDEELQKYLTGYFARTRVEQVQGSAQEHVDSEPDYHESQEVCEPAEIHQPARDPDLDPVEEDDIPF